MEKLYENSTVVDPEEGVIPDFNMWQTAEPDDPKHKLAWLLVTIPQVHNYLSILRTGHSIPNVHKYWPSSGSSLEQLRDYIPESQKAAQKAQEVAQEALAAAQKAQDVAQEALEAVNKAQEDYERAINAVEVLQRWVQKLESTLPEYGITDFTIDKYII